MFKAIKSLYDRGKIDKSGVREAVDNGLITTDEYEIITGEKYEESEAE